LDFSWPFNSYYFGWDSQENAASGMLKNTFLMTAIVSLGLGLFSFTLPKTPPKASEEKVTISDVLGLDALKLLKDRNFLIFFYSIYFNLYSPSILLSECKTHFYQKYK
jgi:Nucleoside H+ symporter.